MTAAEWWLELWAVPAALGFAVLFNVPPRSLAACCLLALIGHVARKLVMVAGADLVLATLLAGGVIGFLARLWAARLGVTPAVFSVSAAIPLVPGTLLYKAVHALLLIVSTGGSASLLVDAGTHAVRGGLTVMALALGIVAPLLLRPLPTSH